MTDKNDGPPFTVERYGSLGESIIAERDWLRGSINKALEWCYKENVYGHVRNELEIAIASEQEPLA